ncbi:zinc finger Xfin-like [Brachionus plicatilis]|uniref:Zinc finger Xfin-like n=1 Tax=Brachionus plicatilis TaxID=10195 RepID=A0A3M7SVT4_BRAPC|nr:zinc finger Xfin-like [Brachionus plicatilis]
MDETVYQCPECNFNADNLNELDSHITENHSNENQSFKVNGAGFRSKAYGYSNSLSTHNDDMTLRDDEDFDENADMDNFVDDEDFFNERNNNVKENYQNENEYEENGLDEGTELAADEENLFANTDNTDQETNENFDQNIYHQISMLNSLKSKASKSAASVKHRSIKQAVALPDGPVINSDNHYERQYTCKRCDFFTNNPRAVLYHRKEFHMEKINVHECQYCQYASQYSGKVERHTLLRHKIDLTNSHKYTPNRTKTELNDSNVLNQSTNFAKNDQQLAKFQCIKCTCKYKRSSDLTKHMRLKHSLNVTSLMEAGSLPALENNEENEYFENNGSSNEAPNASFNPSPYMNRNFNQIQKKIIVKAESGLISDQAAQQILNPSPDTYQCPYCTFCTGLHQPNDYLLHVKEHLCGKAFRCVLCNSVYKYRGDCVVHLKRKHQKADTIAHSYVDKFNLDNLHINDIYGLLKPKEIDEHENEEKLYGCAYCDYKANYKGDVYKHQSRRHPGTTKNVISLATQNSTILSNCSSENNSVNNSFNYSSMANGHSDEMYDMNDGADGTDGADDADGDDGGDELVQEDFFNEKSQQQQQPHSVDQGAESESEQKVMPEPDVKNKCKFCPFVGRSQAKVLLHMATHYNLKQYMCPVCKKRANFKWDIQKHLRKSHNDYESEVVVLSESEARQSIASYMENKHTIPGDSHIEHSSSGSNLSAPHKFLSESVASSPLVYNNISLMSDLIGKQVHCSPTVKRCRLGEALHEAKRLRTDASSVVSTSDEHDAYNDEANDSDECATASDTNYESDNLDKLPVSIAELNIKPYQCLKCGFRSDRKSDTLRHIRVKHDVQPLQAFKFLKILSIKEASETIDEYESTRLYKKVKPVSRDYALINSLVQQTSHSVDAGSALKSLVKTPTISSQFINTNPVHIHRPNPLNSQYSTRSNAALNSLSAHSQSSSVKHHYFRCPYCSFKHKSRACIKKHLSNHFFANDIRQNVVYKCSACTFKSEWQYTCKKHILTSHLGREVSARVVKVFPRSGSSHKRIKILIKRSEGGAQAQFVCRQNTDTDTDTDTHGQIYHNDQENDNCVQSFEDEEKMCQESVMLTGYDGQQFAATYMVSNVSMFNGSQNGANGVPFGKKAKLFLCQSCPYKTSNYCTLKQHLLQHKFRDGFYKCRYCPYYVGMIRLLKQHEIIHKEYAPRESCSLESAHVQNMKIEPHQMPIAQ